MRSAVLKERTEPLRRPTSSCLAACLVALGARGAAAGDLPPGFVDAQALIPTLAADMRYAGPHNFTGAPVEGYGRPRCWLTREAATALAQVQADLEAQGLGLLVFDCYRPRRAVRRFVAWAAAPDDGAAKSEFYPNVAKTDLLRLGYIAARSAHSRGSTVDLTLIDKASGRALDMGTPFDLFGPASHPNAPGLPRDVVGRRIVLREAMRRRGFVGWWHFTLAHEPYPDTSFDMPIR